MEVNFFLLLETNSQNSIKNDDIDTNMICMILIDFLGHDEIMFSAKNILQSLVKKE